MAIQILRRLKDSHGDVKKAIIYELGLDDSDLVETMEGLYQQAIDAGEVVECGCCGYYHRPEFAGDCRNDDERFPAW